MLAYHGTAVRGLQTLTPFANPHSNLKYPCVYPSTNEALASIYIWSRPYKWMTFEIHNDMPVYNESFEGCLKEFYSGVSGCIYQCDGDFETDENTTIKHAVISKSPVAIKSADLISDAYEHILRSEAEGKLIINHFATRSDEQRQRDRNMVLGAIKRLDLLRGEHILSAFVAEKFPHLWDEAKSLAEAQ